METVLKEVYTAQDVVLQRSHGHRGHQDRSRIDINTMAYNLTIEPGS